MKIGQKIVIKQDTEIRSIVSDVVNTAKKGDIGFVDSNSIVHMITGDTKGKLINFDNINVNGYDHDNIANLIYNRLANYFNLNELLDYEGIEIKRFIEEIEDVLMDIL